MESSLKSNYFSANALKALNRMGDILIPRNEDFPSFSEYGAAAHVDDIAAYAGPADISTLNSVLGILAFMPDGVLHWLARRMENSYQDEGPLGSLLRLLNLGLRGILFTLYYSGKAGPDYQGTDPLDLVGYAPNRVED